MLTPDDLADVLLLCMATPMDGDPNNHDCLWGLVPNIIGEPGLGKSAITKRLCVDIGTLATSLFASQHPPEDFSGALMPDGQGGARQFCPLAQVREIVRAGTGVIFLDEINGAPPATQGALQSFIHERIAGDEKMPGGVRITAASNPEAIATGGHRLSPAFANRLVFIDYNGGPTQDWIKWNMGGSSSKKRYTLHQLEGMIKQYWGTYFPQARGLLNGFMQQNQTALHKLPDKKDPQAGRAWPSRRTWDFVQRAWATAQILGTIKDAAGIAPLPNYETIRDLVIDGCVGSTASAPFYTYAAGTKIPTPQEVLDGTWKPDINRLDITFAAYTSMVGYVVQTTTVGNGARSLNADVVKTAVKAWEATGRLLDTKPPLADVVAIVVTALANGGLGRDTGNPDIKNVSTPILNAINRAGVLNAGP